MGTAISFYLVCRCVVVSCLFRLIRVKRSLSTLSNRLAALAAPSWCCAGTGQKVAVKKEKNAKEESRDTAACSVHSTPCLGCRGDESKASLGLKVSIFYVIVAQTTPLSKLRPTHPNPPPVPEPCMCPISTDVCGLYFFYQRSEFRCTRCKPRGARPSYIHVTMVVVQRP